MVMLLSQGVCLLGAVSVGWTLLAPVDARSSVDARTSVNTVNTVDAIRIDTAKPLMKVFHAGQLIHTYPVALGKPDSATPIGSWRIVNKQRGWGSGFGTRWLGLDVPWGIYGIHGTNRPASIGQFASNGCIRMRNQDVEQLYALTPVGASVIVTGDPLRHLRNLEYGHVGADVQLVQQKLRQAGFYRGPCDGRFGVGTQFSLVYFELSRQLPMDGVVGVDDYRALGLLSKKTPQRNYGPHDHAEIIPRFQPLFF